jgi:hypothetical protein
MQALSIIETHNVKKDVGDRLLAGRIVLVVNALALQRTKEALHRCVVIAVASATHTNLHAQSDQQLLISICGILAAAIGMMEQAFRRGNIGDIRQPFFVGPPGLKLSVQMVRSHAIIMLAVGGVQRTSGNRSRLRYGDQKKRVLFRFAV